MRSLRARVFVTVAVVVAAATAVSGLLSRRATLVEERQMQFDIRRPGPDPGALGATVQQAFLLGGWPQVRGVLLSHSRDAGRLLAVDAAGRLTGASDTELAAVDVTRATSAGGLTLVARGAGTVARLEFNGVPVLPVRDAAGDEAGRVYVLPPGEQPSPHPARAFVPGWLVATIGTALVALLVTFALSGRILGPVSKLTDAARRMREGDLDVRVAPEGDNEIARLARAFNEMAERLAQTERMKRQMVGDIAHELRSPVTNLRCGLESIQDGLVTADAARIDALHSETLLLQRLIADLQDLALAESGGLALHLDAVDVAAVARRAIGDGPSRVSLRVDDDAAVVRADAVRLEQMLRNLLSNARRHTAADGTIDLHVQRRGAFVRVSVIDSGCGIAAEHLPHVFDRFYRVDGSRDRSTGGAGLGLAIVRRLAEAQGGAASASSAGPGQGATFAIDLPVG